MLRQITSGLQYLHSFKIAHGDLKPSNILISIPKDNSSPKMKLADFGLSHAVRNKDDSGYEENQFRPACSKGWMCPFDAVGDDGKWELSFDVFPLGVLFAFAALKGAHPFGKDLKEATLNIKNRQPLQLNLREIDSNVYSPPFMQLLARMVSYDPLQRPTSLEIFNHPFFTQQPIMATARQQHPENAPVEPLPFISTARRPNGEALVTKMSNQPDPQFIFVSVPSSASCINQTEEDDSETSSIQQHKETAKNQQLHQRRTEKSIPSKHFNFFIFYWLIASFLYSNPLLL